MTDHDFRATAYNYLTSLQGTPLVTALSGSFVQHASQLTGPSLHMLAESSSATAPASVLTSVQAAPAAANQLRTSIAGHQIGVTFGAVRLDPGATWELRVQLSVHPAYGSRPAGQFALHYQFGAAAPSRSVSGGGLVGIVAFTTPAAGSTTTLDVTADVQALWPDMLGLDNCLYALTLVATSPRTGVVADLQTSISFARTANDAASVLANQRAIVAAYGPRNPRMSVWPAVEISRFNPHVIPFGVPQFFPDQSSITAANAPAFYAQMVAGVHGQGGVVSWNHPFGTGGGAAQSQAQQDTHRRSVFAAMLANSWYGTDILEVGYTLRGQASTATHLALWDTFSRRAVFLTGTGVNDDHMGLHWATLTNGFSTGIWANTIGQPDVVAALAGGRAYAFHAGQWPQGTLDMSVDGLVPMGKVSVSSATSRSLVFAVSGLPIGSTVEVVRGAVDYTGTDPSSVVVGSFSAASLGTGGTGSLAIDTGTSCFVRAQVRTSTGALVGIGNPVWLLQAPPPSGIPAARNGDALGG